MDMEIYQAVFGRVVKLVDSKGLLDGSRLGVDATMMEANAAMRSIVRKDTKENNREYVDRLPRKPERRRRSPLRSESGSTESEKGRRHPTRNGNRRPIQTPGWAG